MNALSTADPKPTPSHQMLLEATVAEAQRSSESLRDSTIYITGASGFLAASLLFFLDELNRQNNLNLRLYASARRPMDQIPLFDFLKRRPEVTWEVAPVETARVPEAEALIVIHTASYGSPRDYLQHPIETFEANTQSLIRLFRQCHPARVKQFVYFSSAEVYGQPPEAAIPTPESFVGGTETLSVRSIYGESKRMGETLGTCLGQDLKIPFTVLRPWNLYGPGQRQADGRVPMEFIRQARRDGTICLASDGTPRRAFCYVWDGLRQVVATLGRTTPVEAFNIGYDGEEISVLELARLCATTCGLPAGVVRYNPAARVGGLQRCAPDIRAVQELIAKPCSFTPLATGLRLLREWSDFLEKA